MIKINLLRTSGLGGAAGAKDVVAGTDFSVRDATVTVTKILLAITPMLLLYIWEYRINADLDDQIVTETAEMKKFQAEKSTYGDTGPRVELYTKEKQKVDHQMELIRTIARNRLREVKAFDALQSLVPQRTWFKKLELDGTTLKMSGFTSSDEGIVELMKSLEGAAFFSGVEPKETNAVTLASGPAKKFELSMHLGKPEKAASK